MKSMTNLLVLGNRLRLSSWNGPFRNTNTFGGTEGKRQSRRYSSAATPVAKEADIESAPDSDGKTSATAISKTETQASNLTRLAGIITRETEKLDRYIKETGSPEPSFDVDGPLTFTNLPDELRKSREEVARATKELGDLIAGPRESLRWMAWDVRPFSYFPPPESTPTNDNSTTTPSPCMQSTTTKSLPPSPCTVQQPSPPSPTPPVWTSSTPAASSATQ